MNQQELELIFYDLPLGGIQYYKSLDSTNNTAVKWAATGAKDFSLVVADEQTGGRGRSGNRWYTYPGTALAFSLIIRPTMEITKISSSLAARYTGLGSLGVSQVMQVQYDLPSRIKWPNDVLLNGRKFCGVLVEAQWEGDILSSVVLGIGINVTKGAIPPSDALHYPATCMENELGYSVDRISLLHHILRGIIRWQERIMKADFLHAWESNLAFRGSLVRVSSINHKNNTDPLFSDGIILGLDSDGQLRLRTNSGEEISIQNGSLSLPEDS
jgi:BirA family biotin operon repressor/biotin-[acetyl-CoA-carboxylase] ligase